MKYRTLKALPNIPIGSEFDYPINNGLQFKDLRNLKSFIEAFGLDNDFFELIPSDHKKPRPSEYHCVGSQGDILYGVDTKCNTDNYYYTTHNYFKTSDEAIQYRDYMLALGRINHSIHEMNEGWKSQWKDSDQLKYFPIFIYLSDEWKIHYCTLNNIMSIFAYAKSEEILKTLFVEMKDDFETVRKWAMR